MSRNGSGSYTPPGASFPAVSGATIDSAKYNAVINDLGSALTQSIANDGQTVISANLPMSGFKHTGAAVATASGQYVEYSQYGALAAAGLGSGSGIPAFTARSAGTKVNLLAALTGSTVDWALGTESGAMWRSIPSAIVGSSFKSYAGVTQIETLDGTGAHYYVVDVPGTPTDTTTLTIAQMTTKAIRATPTAPATYTLPTANDIDTALSAQVSIGMGFDWTILNGAAFAITMAPNTNHTLVGNAVVNTVSAFRTRKSAANTYVTYRIG